MVPYLILLCIPSVFALFNTNRLSLPLWYLTTLIYILFVGFRVEVGADWRQYSEIHRMLGYTGLVDVFSQAEPLSHSLFWLSEASGAHMYLTNIVAATIMMVGITSFARRTVNPWLALVSATPYYIIVMGMSGIRQAIAGSAILFLFSRWERYSLVKRSAYIFVAAMFHTSALINNIFLVTKLKVALRYKLMLGAVIFAITMYLAFEVPTYSENFERYQDRYLGGDRFTETISAGSLYHIAMIAIPALIGYVYRRRIRGLVHNESLLKFGVQAALVVFAMNFFSSTAASRLTVYLYFIPMMVYPALATPNGKPGQLGNIFMVIALHVVILVSWFQLANVSFTYMPYRNLLFDD